MIRLVWMYWIAENMVKHCFPRTRRALRALRSKLSGDDSIRG